MKERFFILSAKPVNEDSLPVDGFYKLVRTMYGQDMLPVFYTDQTDTEISEELFKKIGVKTARTNIFRINKCEYYDNLFKIFQINVSNVKERALKQDEFSLRYEESTEGIDYVAATESFEKSIHYLRMMLRYDLIGLKLS